MITVTFPREVTQEMLDTWAAYQNGTPVEVDLESEGWVTLQPAATVQEGEQVAIDFTERRYRLAKEPVEWRQAVYRHGKHLYIPHQLYASAAEAMADAGPRCSEFVALVDTPAYVEKP